MAVTERTRHQLHQRLEVVLGEPHSTTLIEHLPPVGWADVATKRDLDLQTTLLGAEIESLGQELRGEVGRLDARLDAVRFELEATFRKEVSHLLVAVIAAPVGVAVVATAVDLLTG